MNQDIEAGPRCSVDLTWPVSDQTSISSAAHPPDQHMRSVHTQWEDPAQQDHTYCQTASGKDVQDKITQCDEFGYFMLQNDADALLYTGLNPLSSLRLIVPPLQLVSAALWGIVKRGDVVHYGLLEEFISTVLETVPELLTDTERVQLVVGLRAKVLLELCHNDDLADLQAIRSHLSRINNYIKNQDIKNISSEVEASVTNFLELVNTLMDDQCQSDIFYQKIFSTVFGTNYDSALQALMRKFLLNLHKLLPVPNLEQTSLWLNQSPSILKECVDLIYQPEPLNTLIRHHKRHGHNVPKVSSSSADDRILSSLSCRLPKAEEDKGDTAVLQGSPFSADDGILSSLSYRLPKVDNDEGDTLYQSGLSCVSQDSQIDNLLASESENIKKENLEIKSELMWNIEITGQQHANDLAEDEGASIEVILQPFDETESFNHVRTGSRKSNIFKCLVCGKDFGSRCKLKKHKTTHHDGLTNKRSQSNSATHKIQVHLKPKTCIDNNTSRREAELSPLGSDTTDSPPNVNRLSDFEQSDDDCDLVCHVCGKVYTYQRNFDKHQKICMVSSQQQAETDQQCSTSSAHHSRLNPADTTKESPPSETDTGPSNVVPQESLESSEQQTCKRSSRVKQCSVCQEVFTCSADLMSHMRCHIEQKDSDSDKDCETHQEDKRRVSQQHSQDNPLSNATKRKQACNLPLETTGVSYQVVYQRKLRNKQPNVCSHCGKHFTTNRGLKAHMVRHTGGYPCPVCGKKFNQTTYLKWHLYKHTGKEPYLCETCGKGWPSAAQLKCHMIQHTEERQFKCEDCGLCYKRECHLISHRKTVHLWLRPFSCRVCKKAFRSKKHLKEHMTVHTEERPFMCTRCGKKFKLKVHLQQHSKKPCR